MSGMCLSIFQIVSIAQKEECLDFELFGISSFHLGGDNQILDVLHWSLMTVSP